MVLLKLPWGADSRQDAMESFYGASPEKSPPRASVTPPVLPVEIWQQIIFYSMEGISVRDAFRLRVVSRDFSLMAMKAIYESGILRRCWHLPEGKRRNKFWVDYLTARVMNKVLTLQPSSEHLWLRAIAERILEWREEERARGDRLDWSVKDEDELENIVRQISEFAAFQGEFSEPLNFYLGLRTCGKPWVPMLVLDERCGLFRDALLAVAVYLNEITFLHDRLDAGSKVTCTHHPPLERHKGHYRPAPFNCHPIYEIYNTERFGRKSSETEDAARFSFGSPISVAMRLRRTQCLTALIKSLEDFPSELLLCRAEMMREADRLCNMEYMHLAIEADPPFTACPAVRPRDYGFYDDTRKEYAVKIFRDFFNTTTFLEVFDLLYPIMTANCQAGEVPYWDYYNSRDDFARWGTKRMYRAIRDGCLPIVKRLVQLKFSIGPQPMVEALESGYDCMVEYFLSLGVRFDGALAVPARTGDVQMAQLLLDKGAGKNKESVRNAIEEAMIHGNEDMVMFLIEKAPAKGLLNKKAKANLKRVLGYKNQPDMLPLLKLL
ncbi:uncharacterized protein NECHADRAFT_75880 [Fusarium vanettenii 77-13-4]|uniref:Uncharacterized protein n=1 Tax=Fusarium vanettenii (strain ATCC MYA-4622 / CBS 123669 / FGSC 9596 / NRRL 45880 / 77-13-4) TaxID=660122 RepID=C7Z5V2_FUSV7|nr:uncharacterized protein NECHADRAFT_75880 [Fusarium vanettenii 77-13-4]EEU40587.1 hypothetical protein NECHADRAFT_75880 [Fusarium vanettenii 77-13-4]